jgi:SAM-dependent methyltransferase
MVLTSIKAALPARYRHAGRRAILLAAGFANAGSAVACPYCGRRVRRFVRLQGVAQQCPGCGSLMRHRAVLLYLRDALGLPELGGHVLHVAPERALGDWLASIDSVRCTSLDVDSPIADVRGDVTAMPFADESFDLIVCLHVLEHVPDDRAAIAELFRVLRPGGRALIQVPPSELQTTFEDASVTSPSERERVFGQYDHVRICGADYGSRLAAAGFRVSQVDYVARLDRATRARYGLSTGEPFYVCYRRRHGD